MSEQWRTRTRTAFRFWEHVIKSWDEAQESDGLYAKLIAHFKRVEDQTTETFKPIVTRGADPVYLLHPLIKTCDEDRVSTATGFPQVYSQERTGSLDDLRDFSLITESDLRTMEVAAPASIRAGQPVDRVLLQSVRTRFEAMPEPPVRDGYVGEQASVGTTFTLDSPPVFPLNGRPGEHWFNTGIVLLDRHLDHTGLHPGARQTSIALLVTQFCSMTNGAQPLNVDAVRHCIAYITARVTEYREYFNW